MYVLWEYSLEKELAYKYGLDSENIYKLMENIISNKEYIKRAKFMLRPIDEQIKQKEFSRFYKKE